MVLMREIGARRAARGLGVVAVVLVGLLAAACEQPDWKNPEYLSKQVETGDRLRALDEIARLDEEGKARTVPALINAYNNNTDKEKVFAVLAELRDKRAKSVYVDALKHAKSNRDRAKGAIALGEIQATEHIPTMVDIFRNVPNEDLRRSILEGFSAMPDAQAIPLLVEILTTYDPDREPIAYHAYACEVLAAVDQPTDTVVKAVVFGMYLDNAKGQNVAKECSVAVASVGKLASKELLTVAAGKHEKVNQRFAKYSSYIEGTAEVNAIDALGMLHDKETVAQLMELLVARRDAPPTYRNERLLGWGQKRNEFFVATTDALGRIGYPAALEALSKFVMPSDEDLESYKAIIDYDKRMKLFMVEAAIKSVNALGDRKGLEVLATAAQKGDLPDLKGYGDDAVFQSRWQSARAFAMLGTGDDLETWNKMVAAEKVEGMKQKFDEFRPALEAANTCKQDAACYGKLLAGGDPLKAEKAAWELGRMERGGAAEEQLFNGIESTSPEMRSIVIENLYRVATKKTADKIAEVLKKEEDRATPEFKILHVKMKGLMAYIANQGG